MTESTSGDLNASLHELARLLFTERNADETLEVVARLAQQALANCDAASMTLMEGSKPTTTVSTDPLARAIDEHQYRLDSGPCLDAIRKRTRVRVDDMATSRDWPEFAAAAVVEGVNSSMSYPLIAGDDALGALNMYSRTSGGFVGDDDKGEVFARQAAITLANVMAFHRAQDLAANLALALENRDVIGQAKGILIITQKLGPEEAFDVLRRASQRSNRKLHEIAREMVDRASAAGAAGPSGPSAEPA